MSELCSPRNRLSTLVKSDFFLFISFIVSHPLHFAFLIFCSFSPHLHSLISFLFPLFLTTSLFLLAFLTFIPNNSVYGNQSVFLTAIVGRLRSKIDNQRQDPLRLEDFEVFRLVFEFNHHPTIHHDSDEEARQIQEESEAESSSSSSSSSFQEALEFACLSPDEALPSDSTDQDDEKLGNFGQELDHDSGEVKKVTTNTVEKTKIAPFCTGADKVVEKQGSEAEKTGDDDGVDDGDGDNKIRRNNSVGKDKGSKSKLLKAHSHSIGASADYTNNDHREFSSPASSDYSVGSYGSMRKEKEWKRTLACKLFEERNNNGGESEGMDLLWETYESTESAKNRKKMNMKKIKDKKKHQEIEEEEEEDEERDSNGQLCCLQALKFSTGKMNLGMGRPNLVKISKAIKGIGWLHSLRSSRHSKKVHNGDKY